ncbi:MAG: hypothetical protein ACLTYW_02530 [Collinsella sp.]
MWHRGARRGLDLLICGKMAVDGDTAQIGPELAGAFEIPCVTDVSCVQSAGFTTCGRWRLFTAAMPARRRCIWRCLRDDDCQGDWPAAHAEHCRYSCGRGGGRAWSALPTCADPRVAALPARRRRSCARLCPTATKRVRPLRARRPSRRQTLPRLSRDGIDERTDYR